MRGRRSNYICVCVLGAAGSLFGQLAPSAQPASGPSAIQLPLSGRTGQAGSVVVTQVPVPGATTSVNTINTNVQTQGAYQGSVPAKPLAGPGLGLRDAIQRGLEYNLGAVGVSTAIRQAAGQRRVARSGLMPNVNSSLRETVQQTNLRAMGLRIPFVKPIVGPFNYFDLRATLTQSIADLTVLNNYRSAKELREAAERNAEDARDLIVLAVGGAYLQTVAANARVQSSRAQVETAKAVYDQTVQRKQVGLVAQIDVNRSQVDLQTRQQRLTTLENDLAKQKINLARLVGLPPSGTFELTDPVPFASAPELGVDDALKQAFANRSDLKAAEAQVRAAERARAAARAERLPSLAFNADYGVIGINPAQSHGTFSVTGSLRVPIWQGGRVGGEIEQADAALDQRKAELEDLRGRIEAEVRSAFLDVQAAATQVEVAKNNQQVARDTLRLTRDRYEAGITDIVEVVQSQEAIATSELDYITSVFSHSVAKLTLARAMGRAEESYARFLGLP